MALVVSILFDKADLLGTKRGYRNKKIAELKTVVNGFTAHV